MVHRLEQFYQTEGEAGRRHSNLTDLCHRNKKSTPRDFCPKGKADGLHPSLKNQDREDLKRLHKTSSRRMPFYTHMGLFERKEISLLYRINR